MGSTRRQLQWIHHNRKASQADTVGKIAHDIVDSQHLAGPAWRRSVYAILEEHGGAELLKHVGGIGLRDGILKLEALEPAAVYRLGLLWEQPLLKACQSQLPAAGIHTVRFTVRPRT